MLRTGFERWLTTHRDAAPATLVAYEHALLRLERFSGVPRHELGLRHIYDFMRCSDFSAATKQQAVVAFRRFHHWGTLPPQGYWPADPELNDMRLPRQRHGVRPTLSREDCASLLAAAVTPDEVRVVYLGLYAGLRATEIASVDADAWQGRMICVRAKGGGDHRIPIHKALLARRDIILATGPRARKHVALTCRRLRPFVGDQPMTPHWLRRTYAQRLVACGTDREVVGALLGHSTSSVTTRHYAGVSWQEMIDAHDRLEYPGGGHAVLVPTICTDT